MYVGDDTRTMTFVLREVMHMHTNSLGDHTTNEMPGKMLRVIASPLSSMIKKVTQTDSEGKETTKYLVNTLGITTSRWREIRYVGTRVQFVPLATTGRIDPADITQSASGVPSQGSFSPQGSIHPYDAMNFVHWRRWTGGNINIPAWPSGTVSGTGDEARKNYAKKSLAYDQEWLADDRFNHVKLTDGMQFDSVPLRVDLETSALAGNSLFGFSTTMMMTPGRDQLGLVYGQTTGANAISTANTLPIGSTFPTLNRSANYVFDADLSKYFQPAGLMAISAGKEYHEEGWLPNPFAGFKYKPDDPAGDLTPGDEKYQITGYLPNFPWFADRTSLTPESFPYDEGSSSTTKTEKYAATVPFLIDYLINLCVERFLAPIALIRLPPAYGTMFYWTAYMAHVFQVRKPFLTNSAWTVGKVEDLGHDVAPVNRLAGIADVSPELVTIGEETIYQAIGPDPYGLAESPMTVTLADLAPNTHVHAEPWRVISIQEENRDGQEESVHSGASESEES